jgi:hypothetical protein
VAAQQARAGGFALDLTSGGPDADDADFREYGLMASASDRQFVTLGLGAEVFAVPVAYVREILDYPRRSASPKVRPT